jgi:hypothetical protein
MDGYDDVLQFINKVGDQNLNYRSFQTGMQPQGQSKWHLINQVASYKQPLSERPSERVVPLNSAAQTEPEQRAYTAVTSTALFADAFTQPAQTARFSATAVTSPQQKTDTQALSSTVEDVPVVQQKEFQAGGFAHLFKKPQQQESKEKPAVTDSLSALFNRIGS